MTAAASDPLIRLAERVAAVAAELGISTALIGAAALAAHNYVRGTADIDLAAAVDPFRSLAELRKRLQAEGYHTELHLPDAEDSLGGLLRVRAKSEEDDPLEIVNFVNPLSTADNPGREAVQTAERMGSSALRCVTLPYLIALKLYAGSRRDQADVVELLRQNPEADTAAIRGLCARYGSADVLEELLREANS